MNKIICYTNLKSLHSSQAEEVCLTKFFYYRYVVYLFNKDKLLADFS